MREMTTSPHHRAVLQAHQMTTKLRGDDIFTESLHCCSEASEIVGPAAKVAVTVPVDSCRFFPADPLPPSPAACLLPASRTCPRRPSRSLLKDEHALQWTGRGQTASLSGSLP